MLWTFVAVLGVALGAVLLLCALIPSRRFGWQSYAVLCGLAVVFVVTAILWREAILVLAVSALVFLAVAVMLQKVPPRKAIVGALAALLLLFAFTWLARQLAQVFLFDQAPQFPTWLRSMQFHSFKEFASGDYLPVSSLYLWPSQNVVIALGIACLIVTAFLRGRSRAAGAFLSALLLTFAASSLLADQGFSIEEHPFLRDPFVQFALLLLGAALLFRLIACSNQARRP